MIQINKEEAYAVRKVHPTAEIARTRNRRYLTEERRYLQALTRFNGNEEAKEILRERYDCIFDERV